MGSDLERRGLRKRLLSIKWRKFSSFWPRRRVTVNLVLQGVSLKFHLVLTTLFPFRRMFRLITFSLWWLFGR